LNFKETQQNTLHIQAMVNISRDPQKIELNEEIWRGVTGKGDKANQEA
jgi:hypothetical protein